ncbi:MAG: cation transporter, partial [Ramlibacter sp.]
MQAAILPSSLAPGAASQPGAVLDDRDAWETFGRPLAARAGDWESYLAIEGMDCAACALVIEQALAGLPGVHAVEVNGSTATARVEWSPAQGRPSQWLQALERAGYRGWPASEQLRSATRRQEQRM